MEASSATLPVLAVSTSQLASPAADTSELQRQMGVLLETLSKDARLQSEPAFAQLHSALRTAAVPTKQRQVPTNCSDDVQVCAVVLGGNACHVFTCALW
jgi:hypothetical protein